MAMFGVSSSSFIKNQHGNALWFILLAVALLGMLAATISRSGSSVEQSGSVEQNRIKAGALLRYSQSIEQTVQRMIMNGISENDLDFVGINASHDNTNCSDTYCQVFHVEGGGAQQTTPAKLLGDSSISDIWHISTGNRIYQMGCDTANKKCTELLMLYRDIPKAVCLQVNKLQDITNPSSDAPQIADIEYGSEFTGSFTTTIATPIIGGTDASDDAPQVRGKTAGCVYDTGASKYYFYQALLVR